MSIFSSFSTFPWLCFYVYNLKIVWLMILSHNKMRIKVEVFYLSATCWLIIFNITCIWIAYFLLDISRLYFVHSHRMWLLPSKAESQLTQKQGMCCQESEPIKHDNQPQASSKEILTHFSNCSFHKTRTSHFFSNPSIDILGQITSFPPTESIIHSIFHSLSTIQSHLLLRSFTLISLFINFPIH